MIKRLEEMNHQELADWIASICLSFGSEVHTAYYVAAVFIEGLKNS